MTNERISDSGLRNIRAWASARPDMSGSQAIMDAIDELLERRLADEPTPSHYVDDETGRVHPRVTLPEKSTAEFPPECPDGEHDWGPCAKCP